jgi:hypothetical protein
MGFRQTLLVDDTNIQENLRPSSLPSAPLVLLTLGATQHGIPMLGKVGCPRPVREMVARLRALVRHFSLASWRYIQ